MHGRFKDIQGLRIVILHLFIEAFVFASGTLRGLIIQEHIHIYDDAQ
jgi:hypothetical protein